VNVVLAAINWLERVVFRVLGTIVAAVTALLAWALRRGRFRAWRRQS
jgi:hypothetical protein